MSFDEFYAAYRKHDKDVPVRKPRRYDGYELHYKNGDVYVYDEQLKPGHHPDWNGNYGMDDFICTSTWNGRVIAA